jgi:hypothetical protein
MQGDMEVPKDFQGNKSLSVTRRTGADRIPFRVPHTLDANQMGDGVILSYQRLQVLRSDKEQNFRNIVPRDESRSFLETSVRFD